MPYCPRVRSGGGGGGGVGAAAQRRLGFSSSDAHRRAQAHLHLGRPCERIERPRERGPRSSRAPRRGRSRSDSDLAHGHALRGEGGGVRADWRAVEGGLAPSEKQNQKGVGRKDALSTLRMSRPASASALGAHEGFSGELDVSGDIGVVGGLAGVFGVVGTLYPPAKPSACPSSTARRFSSMSSRPTRRRGRLCRARWGGVPSLYATKQSSSD